MFKKIVSRHTARLCCRLLTSGLSLALLCACHTVKDSEPPRTATEELLLSHAGDEAMKDVDLSWLANKKIFVDDKYFESYDKGYAISLIRQRLLQAGALLMTSNGLAEVMVEIRSGALSINTSETLFGIPSAPLPVPLTGSLLQIPEIAFYKSQKYDAIGKFALFAYMRDSGQPVGVLPPTVGRAHFHLYKIFFVGWKRTDIPELKSKGK